MEENSTRKRRFAIAAVLVCPVCAGSVFAAPAVCDGRFVRCDQKDANRRTCGQLCAGHVAGHGAQRTTGHSSSCCRSEAQDSLPDTVLLTVSEEDEAAQKYARKLARELDENGVDCRVQTQSDAMLRAFAKEGKLQLFVIARDQIGRNQTQAYTVQELTREEMEAVR